MDNNASLSQKPQTEKPKAIYNPYRYSNPPCCEKAQIVFCVCRVKYQCPDHGSRCHGSHD